MTTTIRSDALPSQGNLPIILVVDDSPVDREMLEAILKAQNYRVSLATCGREALALAPSLQPDLVLLDIQMPDIDGYEVCRQLKQLPLLQNIPVIFLSAHGDIDDKVEAFNCGGVDYLTKPFQLAELNARIKTHLSLREYQRRLKQSNQELQNALEARKKVQQQLIQAEKMASLGTLAAGVAHEINNPIGYVAANLEALKQYQQQLLGLLRDYEILEPQLSSKRTIEQIQASKRDADIGFIRDDLPNLVQESLEGIERVKQIVQDLKYFSRSDTGERAWSDLHSGIESTLNVAWNELKYKARVVKEFGALPPVHCVASQINQVILNLLINASHAIEKRGTITIRTGIEAGDLEAVERIYIEVEDDGCGIPEAHLDQLFDPFFTTKPVGKGTGLGLSLSHGIVKQHGGGIAIDSEVGRGSRFRISLPISSAEHAANHVRTQSVAALSD